MCRILYTYTYIYCIFMVKTLTLWKSVSAFEGKLRICITISTRHMCIISVRNNFSIFKPVLELERFSHLAFWNRSSVVSTHWTKTMKPSRRKLYKVTFFRNLPFYIFLIYLNHTIRYSNIIIDGSIINELYNKYEMCGRIPFLFSIRVITLFSFFHYFWYINSGHSSLSNNIN